MFRSLFRRPFNEKTVGKLESSKRIRKRKPGELLTLADGFRLRFVGRRAELGRGGRCGRGSDSKDGLRVVARRGMTKAKRVTS